MKVVIAGLSLLLLGGCASNGQTPWNALTDSARCGKLSSEEQLSLNLADDMANDGKLHAYVCDFPSNLLRHHPRFVALPHLGASTEEAEENCAIMVADQVRDYLENGNILNSVNFPNISMPRESGFRLAIANANVPNMLGQISTTLAGAGLNIHNMVNKSRGDLAFTLVDVECAVPQAVIDQLTAIGGVLRVRYLPS